MVSAKEQNETLSFISRLEWNRFSSERFNLHIKTRVQQRSVNSAHHGSDNHQSCYALKLNDHLISVAV